MRDGSIAARFHARFHPRIRSGVFFWFFSFSMVAIILLWTMQTFFLDDIYLASTKARMQDTAREVMLLSRKQNISTETLSEIVEENRFSVSIYQVVTRGDDVYPVELSGVSFTGALSDKLSYKEYREILRQMHSGAGESDGGSYFSDVRNSEEEVGDSPSARLLYAAIYGAEDRSLMIVLDAELLPVNTTVELIRWILFAFTLLFVFLALLASFLASRSISAPLARLARSAASLPGGKYLPPENAGYREIAALSATLAEVSEELRKSDRYQQELIANVSHDLRTPLTTVIGYSEVMRDFEDERTPENLQLVIDEARHLSDFVQDLLTLSRVQAGGSGVRERLNLTALLSETVERYRRLKGLSGFVFDYEAGDDCYVSADRLELSQVICNLLNNAVNYSGDSRTIEVSLQNDEHFVTVAIRDYGIGIPEEELSRIFDRYYKVDKTHERARVGSGIGLSIVSRILESYSAEYGVESEPAKGSRFWFRMKKEK